MIPLAIFQETEIVQEKANQSPCSLGNNIKGLNPDFAVNGCVKLGKMHNFFLLLEMGSSKPAQGVVWTKGLCTKPLHHTGVGAFCWISYMDPPPSLVR